jgi:hypothetical protein
MGPSSGTLGFYNCLYSFCCSPHIGSAWYVWSFYALFVKYIACGISEILNYYVFYVKTRVKISKMLNY